MKHSLKSIFTRRDENTSPADNADSRRKKSAVISEISGKYFQMKTSLIILSCFYSLTISAQNLFEKIYDTGSFERAASIQQTFDGGYFLSGSVKANLSVYDHDIYLIKTDSSGNILWTKIYNGDTSAISQYGSSSIQVTSMALQTNDSGFVVVAVTDHFLNYDFWLLKIKPNGDTSWLKFYGDLSLNEVPLGITVTSLNEYLIGGEIVDPYSIGDDFWLVKTDAAGNTIWSKVIGGSDKESFLTNKVIETFDGKYILLGSTKSFGNGGYDFYLMKIDTNGDTIWTKTFGTSGDDIAYHIEQTADSGFVLLGSFDIPIDSNKLTLIKADKNGNLLWEKHPAISKADFGNHFQITVDGGFIITGTTATANSKDDVFLIKTDAVGNTLWTKTFGSEFNDIGIALTKTLDNGFGIIANTEGFGFITNDIYFIKTDSSGNAACPPLSFSASDTSFCEDKSVTFYNSSIGTGQYSWLVNDTLFSNLISSTYYFQNAGNYNIKLKSCTDSVSVQIVHLQEPSDSFSFSINKDTVNFSYTPPTNLLSFIWDFGDSTALDSTNSNPTHIYSGIGLYPVTLSVVDSNGCTNTSSQQVSILPNGVLEFTIYNLQFTISPNPFTNSATIAISNLQPPTSNLQLVIYDVLGQQVHQQTLNSKLETLNLKLPSGIYFYKVTTAQKEIIGSGKVVIE